MDIPSLLNELDAHRAKLVAPLEALSVLQGLPLKPETSSAVLAMLTVYSRRERLLARAISALDALERDGYPSLPKGSVIRIVYEDLLRNLRLAQDALALFELGDEPAATVTIVAGKPEPRTPPAEVVFFRQGV